MTDYWHVEAIEIPKPRVARIPAGISPAKTKFGGILFFLTLPLKRSLQMAALL